MASESRAINEQNFPSFSLFRLLALWLILATTIFLRQEVLGADVVQKIYLVSCISFFLSAVSIIFWREVAKIRLFVPYQMTYDLLLTSYLIFHTGINESVFLFLYLLNIIHAAITYELIGGLVVAGLAGLIYGLIYYINKDTSYENQFYTLFYNELFFLLTGLLSGQLMEELKRQAQLLASEKQEVERLRLLTDRLINNLPAGIMLVDHDNYVVSVNKSLLQILDLEELPTGPVTYYALVPELEGIRARWFTLTESEKLKFSFRISKGGSEKLLSLQIAFLPESRRSQDKAPPTDPANSARADLIFVIQDVSQVRELEEKLELDSRLAAVGQLAAGIAHEIRTPLASISGSIETLLKNIKPNNPDDEKLVSISLREIRRLDKLITEFLIFVRPSGSSFSQVNLRKIIEEVAMSVRNVKNIETRPQISTQFSGEEIAVAADAEKLKQVFFNLLMNSIEAARSSEVKIDIDVRDGGASWIVYVRDDGQGIPDNLREKIFNPFFTTKKHGTGLGLANVAQIVKRHGGDIRVVPVAAGALFEIRLPKQGEPGRAGEAAGG